VNETKFKTDPVSNCFSPDVSFEQRIPILDSANSFLAISVWSGKEAIAHWCGGVEMLRQGYRICEMLDNDNNPISKGMCHIVINLEFVK
jgi:hypothetical protein